MLMLLLLAVPAVRPKAGEANAPLATGDLAQGFVNPPDSAKPRTWWHWISGNISREGITADLEAMKRIGLGGAQIFTVDQSAVKGPVVFMSPEWKGLVKHALNEAGRLNLEISMEGCDGWCESGGPWVPVSESMQQVVWTERQVAGGQKVLLDLPQPTSILDFYEDIVLVAFPTPAGSARIAPLRVTSSDSKFDGSKVIASASPHTELAVEPAKPQWIQLEYATPATFRSARLVFENDGGSWEIQKSDDGIKFQRICAVDGMSTSFEPATARFFRVWRAKSPPKKRTQKTLVVVSLNFGGAQLNQLEARTGMQHVISANAFTQMQLSPQEVVDSNSILDLTGQQEWAAPVGNWTILRIGHTSTGATTHPSTMQGLECNKLSTIAVQHHIHNMFDSIFADSPKRVGTTFQDILLDSWEAGCENWTPLMAGEFKNRRGYALDPWIPALTGTIIGSAEQTQRFLWDYRRTLADLVAENHYGVIQAFAHEHHMGLASEAAGIGMPTVVDQLLCKKYTDIPMGEFWVNRTRDENIDDTKEAASAAHLYGQRFVAAESFTSPPATAAWKNDPYSLKALGDEEFCVGINRFVFHRYAHQPWLDRKPGMSMGPWGINFERSNTWWDQGRAWIAYLSRCQYLLQEGRFRADLCYFYGEDAPMCVHHNSLQPAVPKGFDYDVCNADVLLNLMEVENDRIVTPSGMSYRVLVLPPTDRMTLPVLQKVAKLVQAGATVYGQKPEHSPSLTGYPDSEGTLAKLAGEVWGACDGKTVTEHPYGKGKIVWGVPLETVLAAPPDFTSKQGDLLFIHRQEAPAEVYFVSNQEQKPITAECSFRVTGKIPELWHPDTGKRETIAFYGSGNGQTTLPIHFDPVGSVFVVFRDAAPAAQPITSIQLNGTNPFSDVAQDATSVPELSHGKVRFTAWKSGHYQCTTGTGATVEMSVPELPDPLELTGSWQLSFPPKLGAPAAAVFDHLFSWSDSTNDGIKYFSGTAAYEKDFTLSKDCFRKGRCLFLDLGSVKNLAQVVLNGKPLGILWKEPFRVEITGAAKSGKNHLTVKVTNLWPNRLIGDEKLPEKQRITWTSVSLYKADSPLLPSGLLGPVTIQAAQQVELTALPR